jgi:hypothetical protein
MTESRHYISASTVRLPMTRIDVHFVANMADIIVKIEKLVQHFMLFSELHHRAFFNRSLTTSPYKWFCTERIDPMTHDLISRGDRFKTWLLTRRQSSRRQPPSRSSAKHRFHAGESSDPIDRGFMHAGTAHVIARCPHHLSMSSHGPWGTF